jgi:hypothetical protein
MAMAINSTREEHALDFTEEIPRVITGGMSLSTDERRVLECAQTYIA